MIVREMKPFARSIGADRREMRRLSYGSAGAVFVNFADSIITKYTGVLNYQFSTAALVLLEQAEADRQAEYDRQRQVEINWKLITYLVRNVNISVTQPLVWEQMRQNLQEGISRLELADKQTAADMKRIYERFQNTVKMIVHGGTEGDNTDRPLITAADALEEKLKESHDYTEILEYLDYVNTDNRDIIKIAGKRDMRSMYRQDEVSGTPSIFSRSFFLILNRLIKGNRLPDYREIWRRSGELQIREHGVRLELSRIADIKDPEEQLETLNALVAEYGITRIQNSINVMSSESFEKIKDSVKLFRQLESGRTSAVLPETGSGVVAKGGDSHSIVRPDREKETSGTAQRNQQDVRYTMGPEMVYREYVQAQEEILGILENADDKVTTSVLDEKITEFQQVFLQNVLGPDNTASRIGEGAFLQEEGADNPEVFSDWEIERLKIFADRRQVEPDVADEKDTDEKALITRIMNKIWTFACREVTSYYIEHPIKVMNKKILEDIARVLDVIDFRGITPEAGDRPSGQDGYDGSDSLTGKGSVYPPEQADQIRDILAGNNPSRPEDDGKAGSIERMIGVFENGSLQERTLYYLSLERALTEPGSVPASPEQTFITGSIPDIPMDWNRILEEAGGEISGAGLALKAETAGARVGQTSDRRTDDAVFRELYGKLWTEEEQKKAAAGDFRFLLTKQKKAGLSEAFSDMSQQDREYLSMELDRQLEYLSARPEWQNILNPEAGRTGTAERTAEAERSADTARTADAGRSADTVRTPGTETAAEAKRASAETRILADSLNSSVQDTVDRIGETMNLQARVLTVREAAQKAVREVIENTVNVKVEENVFRKLYSQILTEKEQKRAEDGDLGFLFTARKKGKIARILSTFSGEDRQALSEVLERQLDHLESGADWKNAVVYEPVVTSSYEERLLTNRNIISEEIMHEITAPVTVDYIRDARILIKRGRTDETVLMTSLRNIEDFMKPEENIYLTAGMAGDADVHGTLAAYPGRDGQLVLKETDREDTDDKGEKLITRERVQKIEINEQKIDQVSLDLQELKMNLMYKEDELDKMKKTVSDQEKTIKRLQTEEGKKKDLSEDQRRQLMNRLKDEAVIAAMRNGE